MRSIVCWFIVFLDTGVEGHCTLQLASLLGPMASVRQICGPRNASTFVRLCSESKHTTMKLLSSALLVLAAWGATAQRVRGPAGRSV